MAAGDCKTGRRLISAVNFKINLEIHSAYLEIIAFFETRSEMLDVLSLSFYNLVVHLVHSLD